MFRTFMTAVLLAILFIAGSGFSCSGDKRSAFEKGFAASVRVSSTGASAGESILKAYQDGVISLETKDKIFDKLRLIGTGGRQFHNLLAGLVEKYPDGVIPKADLEPVNLIFTSQLYGPLLDILSLAGVLTGPQKAAVEVAMQGLKLLVFTIRGSFTKLMGKVPTPVRESNLALGHKYFRWGGVSYVV